MSIWPYQSESLFISLTVEEILRRIAAVTTMDSVSQLSKENNDFKFTGITGDDNFRISLLLNRPVTFIPLVKGDLQSAATGTLLFLEYKIFSATRTYLFFWTVFGFVAAIVLSLRYNNFWGSGTVLAVCALILWIARSNFMFHVNRTRKILLDILS